MGERRRNDVWYQCLVVFLALFTFLFLIFTTFVSFIGQLGFGGLPEWFSNDVGDLTDKYYLDAAPAGWAFSIWAVIFPFQWGWMIYVLTTLCRRNQDGAVFLNPPVVSPFFLWVYCINLALTITWLFLFDNELLIWSYVDLLFVWGTLVTVFIANLRSVDRYGVELRQHIHDFRAIRILIQNGLAIYLTWITLATLLAMGFVMSYVGDVPQETTSTILLSLLGAAFVGYFLLETFVFERYLRYTYGFWAVGVWALIGIFAKNPGLEGNSLFALILLIVTSVLGLIKVVLSIVRTKTSPLYRTEYVKGEQHKAKAYKVDY